MSSQVLKIWLIYSFLSLIIISLVCAGNQDIVQEYLKEEANCTSFKAYDKLVENMIGYLNTNTNSKIEDGINYLIAATRIDQLEYLKNKNDIEAGRLYLHLKDKYYSEALSRLKTISPMTSSAAVAALQLLIYKRQNQVKNQGEAFKTLMAVMEKTNDQEKANAINMLNKYELGEIIDKMNNEKINKTVNAPSALKKEANDVFTKGDFKKSAGLYEDYLDLIQIEAREKYDEETWDIAGNYTAVNEYILANVFYKRYFESIGNAEEAKSKYRDVAELYFRNSEWGIAKTYYEKIAENYSEGDIVVEAFFRLAACHIALNNLKNAIITFQTFIEKYPENMHIESAYYLMANCYLTMDQKDEAYKAIEVFLERYPRSPIAPSVLYLKGILLFHQGQYNEAQKELKKLAENYPKYARLFVVKKILNQLDARSTQAKDVLLEVESPDKVVEQYNQYWILGDAVGMFEFIAKPNFISEYEYSKDIVNQIRPKKIIKIEKPIYAIPTEAQVRYVLQFQEGANSIKERSVILKKGIDGQWGISQFLDTNEKDSQNSTETIKKEVIKIVTHFYESWIKKDIKKMYEYAVKSAAPKQDISENEFIKMMNNTKTSPIKLIKIEEPAILNPYEVEVICHAIFLRNAENEDVIMKVFLTRGGNGKWGIQKYFNLSFSK